MNDPFEDLLRIMVTVELSREGVEMFNASEHIEWTQQTVKHPDLDVKTNLLVDCSRATVLDGRKRS